MIKLKDFISETLAEIVEGVVEAQRRVSQHGAKVSPPVDRATAVGVIHQNRTESVEFDVRVTTVDSTSTQQRSGVFVVSSASSTEGETGLTESSASHIRFHVWLELPGAKKAS